MFNKFIASILPYFPKKFIWIFSRSYIAGETMADAIRESKDLNTKGIRVTLDVLGEFIKTLDEAEENKREYLELIEEIQRSGIDGNFSLKPTSFGLLIDQEACYKLMREIVAEGFRIQQFLQDRYGRLPLHRHGDCAVQAPSCRISEECRAGSAGIPEENTR